MRLSDIMSHAGLAGYAEVALVLFLFAFILIAVRVALGMRDAELEAARHLPLDDGDSASHWGGAR